MTTSPFTITPTPPTSIRLAPGQEGRLSFTVTSLTAPEKVHEVLLQAELLTVQSELVADDGKGKEVDWLVVEPQQTLRMSGGKTETVAIIARPTADSPRGEHNIRLVIADRDRPNDVYAYSSSVACEVLAPPGGTKPPRPPLPWWLIPQAIVGGLLLIGGTVLAVRSCTDEKPTLGEPCDAAASCDEGLHCVDGRCSAVGTACGKCGGIVQSDGTCSKPTPPNLDQPCGECGGKVTCTGACSNNTPRCPPQFVPNGNRCRSRLNPKIIVPQCSPIGFPPGESTIMLPPAGPSG